METQAKKEHAWLKKFIGVWKATGESPMGPDQPAMTWTSTETAVALGDLWIQADSQSTMPDGSQHVMQLTLGYDSNKGRYVGTWIGSMMDYLWVYEGELDAEGRVLTLSTTGPDMSRPGAFAAYRDIVTFVNDNHRILTSNMQDEKGEWHQFMEAHYHRQ